jgi:homoserine O-acetyltransferase
VSETGVKNEQSETVLFDSAALKLDCGVTLNHVSLAYTTYGTLNADKSNAILICHPLTCDQYPASENPQTGRDGWWTQAVGPGRPIDTDKYFVICSNVLGGCGGSTGPQTDNPDGSGPYGLNFPVITIADMVRAQIC